MSDDDIRAVPPTGAHPAPVRRPRRIWPWVLLAALALGLLLIGAAGSALGALADHAHGGWHVIVNGEPWDGWDAADGIDWNGGGHAGWALFGLGLAGLLLLVVLPISLAFAVLLPLALVGLGLGLALVVTLGSVGAVVLLLGSPFWLLGLLLWLIFRKRRSGVAGAGA